MHEIGTETVFVECENAAVNRSQAREDPANGTNVEGRGSGASSIGAEGQGESLVVVADSWPTLGRPWHTAFYEFQAKALARLGMEIRVLVARPWYQRRSGFLTGPGGAAVEVIELPLLPRSIWAGVTWPLCGALLNRAVERLAPTLGVLFHGEFLAAIAGPSLSKRGIPFSVVVHGVTTATALSRTRFRRERVAGALERAGRVICVGKGVLDHARSVGGPKAAIEVVVNGYDPAVESVWSETRKSQPDRHFSISCVGNLQAGKGQGVLIRAIARLRAMGIPAEATFVGEGPLQGELEALAASLKVRAAVQFAGSLDTMKAARVIRDSSVFALPSEREALGIVYLNAMALGVPVVGVRGTGIDGIVRSGENGCLTGANDDAELASVLDRLYRDSDLRIALGRNGQREVRGRYSWEANAQRIAALLRGDHASAS